MRHKMRTEIIIMFLIGFNLSCSIFHKTQKNENRLKIEIIKGVTTETMALNLLGIPSSVKPNEIGDEIWNYKNLVYSTTENNDGKTLVLWAYTTGDSAEVARPFQLLITFDQNDVLKDFEIANTPITGNSPNQ